MYVRWMVKAVPHGYWSTCVGTLLASTYVHVFPSSADFITQRNALAAEASFFVLLLARGRQFADLLFVQKKPSGNLAVALLFFS